MPARSVVHLTAYDAATILGGSPIGKASRTMLCGFCFVLFATVMSSAASSAFFASSMPSEISGHATMQIANVAGPIATVTYVRQDPKDCEGYWVRTETLQRSATNLYRSSGGVVLRLSGTSASITGNGGTTELHPASAEGVHELERVFKIKLSRFMGAFHPPAGSPWSNCKP